MKKKLVIICLVGILALGLFSLVGCNTNIQKVEGKYYWYEENDETGETQIHKDIYFELFADGTCTLNCLSNALKDYLVQWFSSWTWNYYHDNAEMFAQTCCDPSEITYEKWYHIIQEQEIECKTFYHFYFDDGKGFFATTLGHYASIYNAIMRITYPTQENQMIFLKDGVNSPYIEKDNVLYRLEYEDVFSMHEVADKSVSSVTVAPSIDGMDVTYIDFDAFKGCNELKSLTLSPRTEARYLSNIISCCPKLKDIYVNSDIDNALYLDEVNYGSITPLPQYVTLHFDKSDKEIYKVTVMSYDGTGETCYYTKEGSKLDHIYNDIDHRYWGDNYSFIGYAKAKTDNNGDPVLIKERRYLFDNGVARGENGSKLYYDYDKDDLWDPANDTVTGNIALVPVLNWSAEKSIIIAQKDEFGEWESFDELLSANLSGLETAPEIYNKYDDRFDYLSRYNDVVKLDFIKRAYQSARKGYSALKFFYDKECTREITEDFVPTSTITPIYYTEVEGTIVENKDEFRKAINNNENIYLNADITVDDDYDYYSWQPYSGKINGNDHTMTVIKNIEQVKAEPKTPNWYSGIFDKLDGAVIKDLNIDLHLSFMIAIDPDIPNIGTRNDRICYVGPFAKCMSNSRLENVKLNVEYEVVRSIVDGEPYWGPDGILVIPQVPNNYDVEVKVSNDWQAVSKDDWSDEWEDSLGDNNTIVDSVITLIEKKSDEQSD